MDIAGFLIALVTLVAGVVAGWSLASNRSSVDRTSAAATNASLAAERDAVARERDGLRSERDSIMVERDAATSALRHAELRAQASTTRLEAINESQEQVKETFAQLSNEALQRSNTQFLEMADSRFKLAGAPIAESLTKVEHQLGEIEKDRAGAQRALVQHLESVQKTGEALRAETSSLVSALRKPQARGRWGELQLRRCVEHAGMTDRCDFTEQTTVTTSDGVLRPDMIIKLVGGKSIVVDSKVTLSAFLEAYETDDDAVREERLGAHARHLRQHVDSLAGKAYWSQFSPAPEFVVLFVPSDALLAAALDRDGALIDDAFGKRIHIATPTTLISVLRAVAYAWQQEALATNAQEVFELGREMYKRLGVMGDHMDKLGRSLTGAVKAYNGTVGSLEKNVLVTARKLNALEVVDTELDTPAAVEEPVRTLGATELVTAAEDARTVVALPPATEATPALELEGRPEDYGIDLGLPPDTIGRRTGS